MEDNVQEFNQKEYDEAVEQSKEYDHSVFTLKLKKPFEWEGKTYEELHFDFEKLTGEDSLNVEDELQAKGIMVMVPTFSGQYLIRIAAKACVEHLGSDAFKRLPLPAMNRIRNQTRNFMLSSEQ